MTAKQPVVAFRREPDLQEACLDVLVGRSEPMRAIIEAIRKTSLSPSSVLVRGETGTGKELVARAIHHMGQDRNKPFVTVDCGGLAPTLIESELFGHVRGAFTGADSHREGLLEAARGGTLFLDEIAELPLHLQSRLLRACQEREFRPLGSTKQIGFGARIIAATNQDLEASVARGNFRKDLFYRLNVVSLVLPPLRGRKEDVPALAESFLRRPAVLSATNRPAVPRSLCPKALDCLLAYDWPGNVRELENCLLYAVTLGDSSTIHVKDLPVAVRCPSARNAFFNPPEVLPLAVIESRTILRTLAEVGGDKLLAAKLLGIGKTTLYRKLKEYSRRNQPDGRDRSSRLP